MARVLLILLRVHIALAVLDAHAHGKGLRLHRDARITQHGEGVARAVADREHRVLRGERIRSVGRHDPQRGEPSVPPLQSGDLMREAHLRAEGKQLLPQILQHDIQPVGADVRLGVNENILARAERGELL